MELGSARRLTEAFLPTQTYISKIPASFLYYPHVAIITPNSIQNTILIEHECCVPPDATWNKEPTAPYNAQNGVISPIHTQDASEFVSSFFLFLG